MTELGPIAAHGAKPRDHIVFIDFLRGGAALVVAAFHSQIHGVFGYPAVEIPVDSLTYRFIYGDFGAGVFAVALFFMVSGFLIPSTLERPGATVADFAIRRFFRLYPLYWLSLLAMVLLGPFLFHIDPFPIKHILWNTTMLQGFAGMPDVIGVYWTLQIEVVFYILCAILFALGWNRFYRTQIVLSIVAAIACGLARFLLNRALPVALFLALCLMFLGNLLRHLSRENRSLRSYFIFAILIAAAVVPTCKLSYKDRWLMYTLSYWAALICFTLAYLARGAFERTQFSVRICTLLGCITYGAYLFHSFIAIPIAAALHWPGHIGSILRVGIGVVATAAISVVLFTFVEQPCIELGRILSKPFRGTRPMPDLQQGASRVLEKIGPTN